MRLLALVVVAIVGAACGSGDSTTRDGSSRNTASGPDGSPARADGAQPLGDADRPGDAVGPADDGPQGPLTCPCPLDYLCDLATGQCKPGCQDNASCSPNKYCEPAQRLCKVGCRTVADCKDDSNPCTDLACRSGQCVFDPNAAPCASDQNPCTDDVCQGGSCAHLPANANKVCGASGECSSERCQAGACVPVHESPGTACAPDSDSCTADVCDGQGACEHTPQPDGSACDDIWPGGWDAKCFGGTCAPLRYRCSGSSTLYYHLFSTGQTDTWDGTTSCGCSGKTMKWQGWYSGYFLKHEEYCAACVSSGYSQDCYDLPPSS